MTPYIHIDETTGEQLARVSRDRLSGQSQVRLTPWVLERLRACAYSGRTDDIPPAITRHVFYAHHFLNHGGHGDVGPRVLRLRGAMRRGARDLARTHRGRHAVPRRAVDATTRGGRRPPPPRHQRFPGADRHRGARAAPGAVGDPARPTLIGARRRGGG